MPLKVMFPELRLAPVKLGGFELRTTFTFPAVAVSRVYLKSGDPTMLIEPG